MYDILDIQIVLPLEKRELYHRSFLFAKKLITREIIIQL